MSILGNLIQGFIGSRAEGKAERQRLAGVEEAKGYQTRGTEEAKGYYQPYYQTGTEANKLLAQRLGIGGDVNAPDYGELLRSFSMKDYQQDPGYQFRLQEGLKQLQGKAAARGGALSGATLKGVQGYAQNLASQEYGNAYNRYLEQQQNRYNMLRGQQQTGYQAGGAMSDIANQYAANMANLGIGAGNIRAASTLGKANVWSQALGRSEQEAQDAIKNYFTMGMG